MILVVDVQQKFLKKNHVPREYVNKVNDFLLNTKEEFGILSDVTTDNGLDLFCLEATLKERKALFAEEKHFNFLWSDWKDVPNELLLKIGTFLYTNNLTTKNLKFYDLEALSYTENTALLQSFKEGFPNAGEILNKKYKIPTKLTELFLRIPDHEVKLIGGEKKCVS